jgi:hypothetical protein
MEYHVRLGGDESAPAVAEGDQCVRNKEAVAQYFEREEGEAS